MKKVVLTLAVMLLALNFSFANNDKPKKEVITKNEDGVELAVVYDENANSQSDDLYCSIHCDNGNEYSCWFCSCTDLPDCSGHRQK